MKKILLLFFVHIAFYSNAQNIPVIYGTIKNLPNTTAYLIINSKPIDSCSITNSTFEFKLNKFQIPKLCSIWHKKTDGTLDQLGQLFIAENKTIQFAGDINDFMSLRAKNSRESQILFDLIIDLWYPDLHRSQLADSLHRGLLTDTLKVRQAYDSCRSIIRSYGKKYPNSFAVVSAIDIFSELFRTADYKAMLNEELKVNPYAKKFRLLLAIDKGKELKMVLKDSIGKEVILQSLLKKPTLLVVWATWCAPCRKELNYLKQIGLKKIPYELVTVSTDENLEKWKAYLPNLEWCRGNYIWNKQAASMCGINAIPRAILVDATGKVIDSNFDVYSIK